MNRSRLPPLNPLRAFEAAARHLSVKAAAEELSVTPGAVSQMIRTLETHLGVQLFERVNRGILLTAAGRDYLPPVRNAFRQIADASQRVSGAADSGVLTVSVTPFFASAWLVPRLAEFREACPDVDLQVVTSHALADFSRDGVDVAIRHGLGRYIGLCSERLLTVEIVALASPELVARLGMPATPAGRRLAAVARRRAQGLAHLVRRAAIDDFGPPRGPRSTTPACCCRRSSPAGRRAAAGRDGARRAGKRPARAARRRRVARRFRVLPRLSAASRGTAKGCRLSPMDPRRRTGRRCGIDVRRGVAPCVTARFFCRSANMRPGTDNNRPRDHARPAPPRDTHRDAVRRIFRRVRRAAPSGTRVSRTDRLQQRSRSRPPRHVSQPRRRNRARPAHSKSGRVPDGASARCRDGTYSFSRHRRGTCSGHGGVAAWL